MIAKQVREEKKVEILGLYPSEYTSLVVSNIFDNYLETRGTKNKSTSMNYSGIRLPD
jgi:hypothetical protein